MGRDGSGRAQQAWRSGALAVVGALVGALFVGLAGILTVRVKGAESGAVYDLNNVVVGVQPPAAAYLPMLALAVLAVAVAWAVTLGTSRVSRPGRLAVAVSFAVVVLALVGWGAHGSWMHAPDGQLAVGIAESWRGWLREGARSSGVHVVLLIVLGWAGHLWRSGGAPSGAAEREPQSADVER